MPRIRKNVYELDAEWAEPILWYARGVEVMKARPIDDPTSWAFFGAIHGFNEAAYRQYGYYPRGQNLPAREVRAEYWDQCQHGSWYFLPWHRGYLMALERVLRDIIIIDLNGPDDWALCYWNYSLFAQNALPVEFRTADWPDGVGTNPLYVQQRYGPHNDGRVYVERQRINLDCLGADQFSGPARGATPGFGGQQTGFVHFGATPGMIEVQPHNLVHTMVGGSQPWTHEPGLMSDGNTAALDPVFWLHHANIDRLWEIWRRNPLTHVDPNANAWLTGPPGNRPFIMPIGRERSWLFTPADVSNFAQLPYTYDDLTPPAAPAPAPDRRQRLGGAPGASPRGGSPRGRPTPPRGAMKGQGTVKESDLQVELIGASQGALRLIGDGTGIAVPVDEGMHQKVVASLRSAASGGTPDRIFLNLENTRTDLDAVILDVYLGVRDDPESLFRPENLADSISLFGVKEASRKDGPHGGEGVTFVLEVTDIIDNLHISGGWTHNDLQVRIEPSRPLPDKVVVTIGRVSLYRQGL